MVCYVVQICWYIFETCVDSVLGHNIQSAGSCLVAVTDISCSYNRVFFRSSQAPERTPGIMVTRDLALCGWLHRKYSVARSIDLLVGLVELRLPTLPILLLQ